MKKKIIIIYFKNHADKRSIWGLQKLNNINPHYCFMLLFLPNPQILFFRLFYYKSRKMAKSKETF